MVPGYAGRVRRHAARVRGFTTAGVRTIRCHDPARHTCASVLRSRGVSPRTVMDIVGRSRIAAPQDLRRRHPGVPQEAVGEIDAVLGDLSVSEPTDAN